MLINNVLFNTTLEAILDELQKQLEINHIPLLQKRMNSGNNIQVSCPYHKGGQERKPSMGIHKDNGICHCFTCGETHELHEMISFVFGYTDDYAGGHGWQWLLKNFMTIRAEERDDISFDTERHSGSRFSGSMASRNAMVNNGRSVGNIEDEDTRYISEEELDGYRYYHPYMWERKLTPKIVELFDIGYDKDSECITFPIKDVNGNCLFIARRSIKTKFFNYPENAEKPLYGLYELSTLPKFPDEIVVCESMLDALVVWVYGKYAVAMNGLGTALQFEQLRKLPCRKLILATDFDERGLKARKKLREQVRNKLICEYKMPYEYFREDGKPVKDLNDMTGEQFNGLKEVY